MYDSFFFSKVYTLKFETKVWQGYLSQNLDFKFIWLDRNIIFIFG